MDLYLENKYKYNQKQFYIILYKKKLANNCSINTRIYFLNALLHNSSIPFDIIRNIPDFSWRWVGCHLNKSFIDLNTLQKAINNKEIAEHHYMSISDNPNITLDFYYRNKDKLRWIWLYLSKSENKISLKEKIQHRDLPWKWGEIWKFSKLDYKDIIPYLSDNTLDWNWKALSDRIPPTFMIEHPQYPWEFDKIEFNPYLTESFIEDHPEINFDFSKIICNKNISIEFIQNTHLKYNWLDYIEELHHNPNLKWDFILEHPYYKWDGYFLSMRSDIKMEYINYLNKYHSDIKWSYLNIALSMEISFKDILDHKDLPWDWEVITSQNYITFDLFDIYPELPWRYIYFSKNPNITMKVIKNNPDFPWYWDWISENPAINGNIILNNLDYPWNIKNIAHNTMHIGKQKWIQKQLKKYAKYILEKTYLIDDMQKYILTFL